MNSIKDIKNGPHFFFLKKSHQPGPFFLFKSSVSVTPPLLPPGAPSLLTLHSLSLQGYKSAKIWGSGLERGLMFCRLPGDLKAWEFTDVFPPTSHQNLFTPSPSKVWTPHPLSKPSAAQGIITDYPPLLGGQLSHGLGYIWSQKWEGIISREKRWVGHENSSWHWQWLWLQKLCSW